MRGLIFFLALLASPAAAQGALTEADVRGFLARQEQAWNAGAIDRYFAAYTADARFTDQAYVGDKPPVPYGTSTLSEARTQARRALAKGRSREAGRVARIVIAPDGRSASAVILVGSTLETAGKVRRLCARRLQSLVLAGGTVRSRGQTDTYIRCRGG